MSWFHIGPINSAMFILSFRNQDPITFHGQSTAHQGNVLALLDFFFFGLLLMIWREIHKDDFLEKLVIDREVK